MTKQFEGKLVWAMAALCIGLIVGFLSGRARYKPQVNILHNMVKERDWQISKLKGLPISSPTTQNGTMPK